jgi:hypothetical protein
MTPAPDARVDRLYIMPLDEFTAERNALAAQLRTAGEGDAAAEVKALRKPSRSAWAVNRLVRAEPELLEALLGAGGELRQAHRQAAAGKGAQQLRAAAEAEREAVERLVSRLDTVVDGPVSDALREAVRNTLHAASSSEEARELVAAGRVVRDLQPVGLGPVPADKVAAAAAAADSKRRLQEAQRRASGLGREVEAAERALARAEEALSRAREASDRAAERASDARKRMRKASEGLAEARRNLARLERLG